METKFPCARLAPLLLVLSLLACHQGQASRRGRAKPPPAEPAVAPAGRAAPEPAAVPAGEVDRERPADVARLSVADFAGDGPPPLPRLERAEVAVSGLPVASGGGPVDFRVDFAGAARPVPPGILAGVNDHSSAMSGAWAAYGRYLRPPDGLARIWLPLDIARFGDRHVQSALWATEAGLGVMIVATGRPEDFPYRPRKTQEKVDRLPRDAESWARQVAQHARTLLDRGVRLTHLEIWNEPDLPRWYGDPEAFAEFFSRAGKVLQEALPAVKVGGPGMGHIGARTLERFRLMLAACRRTGFHPAFLSWHDYVGYPTDQEAFEMRRRVADLASKAGMRDMEFILSEWNYGLPPKAILDTYANGAYYVALSTGLIRSEVDHSLFFFLQDRPDEAREDWKGQSVGIFTVHGAPKPVFQGMQMLRAAGTMPSVPVSREAAPWNLTLLATRQGDRGWLLAADAFGGVEDRIRKFLDFAGVDTSAFKNRARQVKGYLDGRLPFERLGAPAAERGRWEEARSYLAEYKTESRAKVRPMRLAIQDAPFRVTGVWALDAKHGDPMADPDFRQRFQGFVSGISRQAGDAALERLRREGVAEADLRQLRAVLEGKNRQAARGLDPRLRRRAQGVYEEEKTRLSREIPMELAGHPAARPHPVPAADYLGRQGRDLVVKMSPFSAVLVELSWERGNG